MSTEAPRGPVAREGTACRCLLFTCALYPRQFGKGAELGADIAVIDLEDSVPPPRKAEARRNALPFFQGEGWPGLTRALRINSLRTTDGLRDILAVTEAAAAPPDILVVPKVESAEDLPILEELLGPGLGHVRFIPMLETARGIAESEEILTSSSRILAVIFGIADLAASVGTTMAWEHMLYARSRVLNAAARGGVLAVDSPCFEVDDDQALLREVRRSSEIGFAGMCAIHPRQVAAVTDGFTPRPEAVDRARRVLELAERRAGQICVLDGDMIGPPMFLAARRLLTQAARLEAAGKLAAADKLEMAGTAKS